MLIRCLKELAQGSLVPPIERTRIATRIPMTLHSILLLAGSHAATIEAIDNDDENAKVIGTKA
jgi:hypothetical protein